MRLNELKRLAKDHYIHPLAFANKSDLKQQVLFPIILQLAAILGFSNTARVKDSLIHISRPLLSLFPCSPLPYQACSHGSEGSFHLQDRTHPNTPSNFLLLLVAGLLNVWLVKITLGQISIQREEKVDPISWFWEWLTVKGRIFFNGLL